MVAQTPPPPPPRQYSKGAVDPLSLLAQQFYQRVQAEVKTARVREGKPRRMFGAPAAKAGAGAALCLAARGDEGGDGAGTARAHGRGVAHEDDDGAFHDMAVPCDAAMYDAAYGVVPRCTPSVCGRRVRDGFATPRVRRTLLRPRSSNAGRLLVPAIHAGANTGIGSTVVTDARDELAVALPHGSMPRRRA